jgi:hypothetical protein
MNSVISDARKKSVYFGSFESLDGQNAPQVTAQRILGKAVNYIAGNWSRL